MNDVVVIWPSIVDMWRDALIEMTTMQFEGRGNATATATMYTDASLSGWGVVIMDYGDCPLRIFAGEWTPDEKKCHINELELRALRIGVRLLNSVRISASEITTIHALIDNTTARAWAIRGRAPQWSANELALQLHEELKDSKFQLGTIRYVESARNIADGPSRKFENKSTGVRSDGAKVGDGAALRV